MTPTTDTMWGWLIMAVLAVATVGFAFVIGAAALAIWDAVLARRSARLAFEAELEQQRQLAFGFCQVIDVDGHPVRIQSDRAVDDRDRWAVEEVVRAAHRRLEATEVES